MRPALQQYERLSGSRQAGKTATSTTAGCGGWPCAWPPVIEGRQRNVKRANAIGVAPFSLEQRRVVYVGREDSRSLIVILLEGVSQLDVALIVAISARSEEIMQIGRFHRFDPDCLDLVVLIG